MKLFSIVFAAGLVLAGAPALAYGPFWIHGTGTATAHDKQLAHDLAFNDAKRRAEAWCDGVYTGASEAKTAYARIEASNEWKATVTIREMCQGRLVMPDNPRNGGGYGGRY